MKLCLDQKTYMNKEKLILNWKLVTDMNDRFSIERFAFNKRQKFNREKLKTNFVSKTKYVLIKIISS